MRFSRKKCLVTGAAGFIGSNMVRRLLDLNASVVGVDNMLTGRYWRIEDILKDFDFIEGDLRDIKTVARILKRGFDLVFNFAANMGGIGYITKVGADVMSDNARINTNLLTICKYFRPDRILFTSSACVYPLGKQLDAKVRPLREKDAIPADPDTFYGWEKLFSEKLYQSFYEDYGLETRIARLHNIYGEYGSYDERAKAPAHLILKAILYPKVPFVIWGDGMQTRSFCYIQDCLDGLLRLISSNVREPINIGSDRLVTILELASIIIDISGKPIEIQLDTSKPEGVRGRNADLTLARNLLQWEPKVSLEDGLGRTYEWTVKNLDRIDYKLEGL